MARRPTFIEPSLTLKQKVGSGGLPAHLILKGQTYLESNPVDFTPFAKEYINGLKVLSKRLESIKDGEAIIGEITKIVMQIKANGSMFHYQLLSMTSDVFLRFIEKIRAADQDFIDILGVYINILTIVIEKRLTGNGGKEGYALTEELHHACGRYYKKHDIS